MNEFLKVAAIGVGGYFLYEWLFGTTTTTVAATTTPSSNTVAVPVTTVPAPTAVYPLPSASALQAVAGAANTMLNFYQWNYYYSQLTGRPTTWPINTNTTTLMTVNAYLSILGANGVSGLGEIINLTDLFQGVAPGTGVGTREFTALGNLRALVDDPNNSAAYIDEDNFNLAAAFGGSQDSTTTDFYLAAEGQGT